VILLHMAGRKRERAEAGRRVRTARAARQIVIKGAADLLSGPGGLPSWSRRGSTAS
jgi:hypothetical protein